jgi:ankyrin repeat protein
MYTVETQGLRVRDQNNVSAVHVAARKNQIEILIYLVENGLVGDLLRARNGATPAHDAAGTGSLDCLRYLLIHTGCSAHDKDFSGQTPLHWAAMFGHLRIVIWLVNECNATINLANKQGLSPIHLAAQKNHIDVLQWFVRITYKKFPNPLEIVNQRSGQGCTPLFLAASEGHIHIVRWLAEKAGGDPTIFSFTGVAPLHAATALGHNECVQYLFQFGLTSSPGGLRTRDGSSVIHMAARCGHIEIVRWLLSQKEISGNEKDHTHYTPSHEAAEHGHFRILKFLFDNNINVDAVDINGYSPLDLAVRGKHRQCENFLKSVSQPHINGKVRRPVVRRGSTGNSHLEDYGMNTMDDVNMQLSLDMEHTITHSVSEEFPTLRDMMGEDEIKHMRQPSDEGDLEQLKKEHEAERKRKDMAAKLKQEQMERNRIMAKKKEEQKKAQEIIREQFLKDSPGAPDVEVEEYIGKTDQGEKRRSSLVEERKSAFEADVESEDKTPKKKGFLSRLRKTVTPPTNISKQLLKDGSHNHCVTEDKPESKKTKTSHTKILSAKEDSQSTPFENEGSSTSLVSSKSGSSAKSGKKIKRRGYVEGGKWIESGEAVRAGMNLTLGEITDSPSGKRRRPRVRKLTPAPVPIKNRLAKKDMGVPKLDLDATSKPSRGGTRQSNKVLSPKELSKALSSNSSPPKYTRQNSQDDSSPPPSPTLADIEDELSKMEDTTLALQKPPVALGRVLVPNTVSKHLKEEEEDLSDLSEEESETDESEEETSEEDSDSTASSDSSDRRRLMMKQSQPPGGLKAGLLRSGLLGPRAGGGKIGGSPRKLLSGGFSRLQRRRVIRLSTIYEDPVEEDRLDVQRLMYQTDEDKAVSHYNEILLQKAYGGWLRYMFMMKAARSKAAVMYRQRKRAVLSWYFNKWLNYTVLERFNQFSTEVGEVANIVESTPQPSTAKDEYHKEEEVEFKSLAAIKQQFPTGSGSKPRQINGSQLSQANQRVPVKESSPVVKKEKMSVVTPAEEKESHPRLAFGAEKTSVSKNPVTMPPSTKQESSSTQLKSYQRKTSFRMSHTEKSAMYLEWLNDQLEPIGLSATNLTTDISSAVPVLTVLTNLSGRKMPQYHRNPRLLPQLMNNWKLVRDEMEYLGMKTMGIEPEDLSKQDEAVIHLMFNVILKWYNTR